MITSFAMEVVIFFKSQNRTLDIGNHTRDGLAKNSPSKATINQSAGTREETNMS